MSVNSIFSQTFAWVMDEDKGYEIPIGNGEYEELKRGDFYAEMEEYYHTYLLNDEIIANIDRLGETKFAGKELEITIVFGAWCGDSKEHLPHFYKIMKQSDFLSRATINLIGCNREKLAGELNIQSLEIEFVPTFIFYIDGIEQGRIIEAPQTILEEDIYEIFS